MPSKLKTLFEYNSNANQKVINLMWNHQHLLSDRILSLMSHIVNAHHIWNQRIQEQTPQYSVWQLHSVEEIITINHKNHQDSITILQSSDLEKVVYYGNSSGAKFANTIWDQLFHIINHSTYHRAQIASSMKDLGIAAAATDYIFYRRDQL